MSTTLDTQVSVAEAFDAAASDFARANSKSGEIHKQSLDAVPGGEQSLYYDGIHEESNLFKERLEM